MSPRARPADCCEPILTPAALAEHERDRLVQIFRALGDPTRLEIFRLIAAQTAPICVCDVVDRFELSQPTISHHLKVLRDVRFVVAERRGTFMYYRVNRCCLDEFPEAARRILNA